MSVQQRENNERKNLKKGTMLSQKEHVFGVEYRFTTH